jgi:hypothetical protein
VISAAVGEADLMCGGLAIVASGTDVADVSGAGDAAPRAQIGKR